MSEFFTAHVRRIITGLYLLAVGISFGVEYIVVIELMRGWNR